MNRHILPSSFRDPSGFVFEAEGQLYRQVNRIYQEDYEHLMRSGLYERLVEQKLLIPHVQVDVPPIHPQLAYQVIAPERVPFISYPYEWSFGQLKDAALTTLRVQEIALRHGMILKDASAYNIQFYQGRPVLIDTLSFTRYRSGQPWIAYHQFCQHFLAPLALMAKVDVRLGQLLRLYLDGVPLSLASRLLPWASKWKPGLLVHLILHARVEQLAAHQSQKQRPSTASLSTETLQGLVQSLKKTIQDLKWQPKDTPWVDYYEMTNYSPQAFTAKKEIVKAWIEQLRPKIVWDLGANTGEFSRIAAEAGIFTVAFDIDPGAVEKNYRAVRALHQTNLLPLWVDLTNPSPALGWNHAERLSFLERGPAEMTLALALIHHLAIGNNVPFVRLAEFLARTTSRWLIVEFVPKSDSQVQKLLAIREDVFGEYHQTAFEEVFQSFFHIQQRQSLPTSDRTLYLLELRT